MRPFFQRSTPTPTASEVANRGISDGVEGKREQPHAAEPQGAAPAAPDRGILQEKEEPHAISTEDADESTSKSEPEPDLTAASAGMDVDAAVKEFDGVDPISPIAKGAVDGVGGADAVFVGIQTLSDTYLRPFKVFNQVVATLSNVHPYAQAALGILTLTSQIKK